MKRLLIIITSILFLASCASQEVITKAGKYRALDSGWKPVKKWSLSGRH